MTARPITAKRAMIWGLGALTNLSIVCLLMYTALRLLLPGVDVVSLVDFCLNQELLRPSTMRTLAVLLSITAAVWASVMAMGVWARRRHRVTRVRAVHVSRGTVAVEFLVVLPVFLLLTFGLGQLVLNLVGGLMANYAGYQASRTAWVWAPEIGKNRSGQQVSAATVNERIRMSVAAGMTPVAPGDFTNFDPSLLNLGGAPGAARTAFVAGAFPGGGIIPGGIGSLLGGAGSVSTNFLQESTYFSALDGNTNVNSVIGLPRRTAQKYTHAWAASAGSTLVDRNGQIGAKMIYKLHQPMPLVGKYFTGQFIRVNAGPLGSYEQWIPFTGMDIVGGRPGFYLKIEREYMFPKQLAKSNPTLPNNDVNGGASGGIGNGLKDLFPF